MIPDSTFANLFVQVAVSHQYGDEELKLEAEATLITLMDKVDDKAALLVAYALSVVSIGKNSYCNATESILYTLTVAFDMLQH